MYPEHFAVEIDLFCMRITTFEDCKVQALFTT